MPYVLGLILLVLALWLALSVVLVATPVVIGAAIFALRSSPEAPPTLPDPEDFDQPNVRERLSDLAQELAPLILRKTAIAGEAKALGISLTNAGRYDQRKKAGRSFNEETDTIDSRSRQLVEEFSGLRRSVAEALPNYRAEFDDWLTRRAVLLAAIAGAKAYMVGLVVGLLMSPLVGESISGLMIGNWSRWLSSGALFAGILAVSAFVVVRTTKLDELSTALDDDKNRKWLALTEFWTSDDDVALQQHVAAAMGSQTSGKFSNESEFNSERWEDALGVSADAPIEDIKAAWKARMKEYHPDRVQTLGPKLKELAEAETKRLNEAYEAALRSRGVT